MLVDFAPNCGGLKHGGVSTFEPLLHFTDERNRDFSLELVGRGVQVQDLHNLWRGGGGGGGEVDIRGSYRREYLRMNGIETFPRTR